MNCNTDNVIFLQHPQDSEKRNDDALRDSAIFYELPQGTPKEIEEVIENEDEYTRKHKVEDDIANCSRTELQLFYPGAYSSWKNAKQRCKHGKGVLHPEFDQFPDFLAAMGPRPKKGFSVDRKDYSNPDYSPANCRWLSKRGQTANRRNTRYLTDSLGTRRTATEWSERWGVPGKLILQRVDRDGWSVDDAVRPERKSSPSKVQNKSAQKTGHYITLWKKILKDSHGQEFFSPTGKDYKQLQLAVDTLAGGKVWPDKALEYILTHWGKFTRYAESHYGAWQKPPSVPTIAYLSANIQAAGNFYLARKTKPVAVKYKPAQIIFGQTILLEPKPLIPNSNDDLLADLEKYDV